MNTIVVPKWVSVLAFLIGLIVAFFGGGTVAWLLGKGIIDNVDAAFIVITITGVSSISHIFVFSTVNLASLPSFTPAAPTPLTQPSTGPVEVYDPATDGGLETTSVSGAESGTESEVDVPPQAPEPVSGNVPEDGSPETAAVV